MPEGESVYLDVVRGFAPKIPRNALVCSMQMSGALLYYDHRLPVRYDLITPDEFQLLRAYADNAGMPWYAVLADFERDDARKKMPGKWTMIGSIRQVELWRLDS